MQFHELQYVATADPMSCTLVHPPAERRPMRKPGAPAPDNMIATGGAQSCLLILRCSLSCCVRLSSVGLSVLFLLLTVRDCARFPRKPAGMQPVVDYSQGQKRLLKTVEHRTWQAAETAAVLQNRYQATDDAARVKARGNGGGGSRTPPSLITWTRASAVCLTRRLPPNPTQPPQLFDTRRERMEAEKRALINFHSQPDWRVSIFESNRRRQLDGSQSLNKVRRRQYPAARTGACEDG